MVFFKKLVSPIVWGNLLVMVLVALLLCLLVWFGMGSYTHHGESIKVPQLQGLRESDANYRLSQLGLHAVVVDSAYRKSLPPGCVLEQVPAAGRNVKSGRNIYLTINTERTPMVTMPDLADNSSLREAQAKLTAIGFRLAPVEYIYGDKDWVYGVKSGGRVVYAGEKVSVDVPLVLQVGDGRNNIPEIEVIEEKEQESIEFE